MATRPDENFNERLARAADARKRALEKFQARPGPDDPAVLERQAALKAIADAREARTAERAAARAAAAAKAAAEKKAREAAEKAAAAEQKAREAALAAEQKAARDARYAARKTRRR